METELGRNGHQGSELVYSLTKRNGNESRRLLISRLADVYSLTKRNGNFIAFSIDSDLCQVYSLTKRNGNS